MGICADSNEHDPEASTGALLALLTQLAPWSDVPVERHRPDRRVRGTARTPTCRGVPSRSGRQQPAAPARPAARAAWQPRRPPPATRVVLMTPPELFPGATAGRSRPGGRIRRGRRPWPAVVLRARHQLPSTSESEEGRP